MLRAALRRRDTAARVHSRNQLRPFNHDTVDVVDLNEGLNREHKQIEGIPWYRTTISSGDRERSDHAKLDVSIYRSFIQRRTTAPCPKLPLDLRDHLCGRSTVLLWQRPLFGDESCCSRMGLGVNGLALFLVLLGYLLLVRRFPHLPLRRREDTSIHPSHCDDGSSRQIRRDCS